MTTDPVAIAQDSSAKIAVYQAMIIKAALRLYAKTGIKPNRAYKPSTMMKIARQITGNKKLKPRDYMGAHDALAIWIAKRRIELAMPTEE